ncbi:MAG: hypothetical protein GF411_11820 [Candidatus Lokiarchaeota archaeon]|nr:hypothetical protein [Candidatus Lokiarchaeota archaeon]
MLKIKFLGHSAFIFETEKTSLLVNPVLVNEEPVVPDDLDVRLIAITNHLDETIGNAVEISNTAKSWILGNEQTIARVKAKGGKPWLLHPLKYEVPYEIPGLKLTPFQLHRTITNEEGETERVDNLGLYIEMGQMRVSYLGDTIVRGGFGSMEADVLITPVGNQGVFPVKDAVSLCIDLQPRIGIPMGWSSKEQLSKFDKYIDQFGQGTVSVIMVPPQELDLQWAAGNEFRYEIRDTFIQYR